VVVVVVSTIQVLKLAATVVLVEEPQEMEITLVELLAHLGREIMVATEVEQTFPLVVEVELA
jgi:hypothetical protein